MDIKYVEGALGTVGWMTGGCDLNRHGHIGMRLGFRVGETIGS